jgi:hypothetical protein
MGAGPIGVNLTERMTLFVAEVVVNPSPKVSELYPKVGRGNGARWQLGQKSVQSQENPLPPRAGEGRIPENACSVPSLPSPACGGGLGWGVQSIPVLTLNERPLPLTPPARGGASKHGAFQLLGKAQDLRGEN